MEQAGKSSVRLCWSDDGDDGGGVHDDDDDEPLLGPGLVLELVDLVLASVFVFVE